MPKTSRLQVSRAVFTSLNLSIKKLKQRQGTGIDFHQECSAEERRK